jgi:hypothetical protein
VLRAAATGADLALTEREPELAAALADRILVLDPWSEHAHRVLIAAHLAAGHIDRARRAAVETWRALRELGLTPQAATIELARRSGVRPPIDR